MTRILGSALAALLLLTLTSALSSPPAAAAPQCPTRTQGTTDLKGLVGSAQPVVLVHGWTGGPMQSTRAQLEALPSGNQRQYFLFDYRSHNTAWPSHPAISACLADYLDEVSQTHRDRGGNGRVFIVVHSMGGIAVRFALDPEYGGISDLASRIGGVITLDTPHKGSMWGASFAAGLLSGKAWAQQFVSSLGNAVPPADADAWVCLAEGARFADCAQPPPMPASVPMQQLVGEVSLRRTLFGVEAYTLNFGGDVIVPSTSQWGGGPDFRSVSCTVSGTDLSLALLPLIGADNAALDIFSGARSTNSSAVREALEPLVRGITGAKCSHTGMPTNPQAIRLVDQTLAEQVKSGGVTIRQLRGPVEVPASCQHEATTISNGQADFGRDGYVQLGLDRTEDRPGPVFADFDGDGLKEAAVVMDCSAGGVNWPNWLLVYGNGPELVGAVYLGDDPSAQEHAEIQDVAWSGSGLDLSWISYEGAFSNPRYRQGTIKHDGDDYVLTDVAPDPADITIGPGTFGDITVGDSAADLQSRGVVSPAADDICDQRWDLELPDGIWGDFRAGDPDTLDYLGVGWNAPRSAVDMVRTAEGAGVYTSVTELRELYGDELDTLTDVPAEGEPYDALVLYGNKGSLEFVIDTRGFDDLALGDVSAMYAVEGTSRETVQLFHGGC